MTTCECGCGLESASDFLPGHDQKLRSQLESRVGGILSLRALVNAAELYAHGESSDDVFTKLVRSLFAATGRRGDER